SRLRQLDATKEGVDASMDPSGNPFQLPDEWIAHQEALGLVRLTLDGMDEQSRQLIRLKFEEEKSYKEISVIMGLTPGHVGYLLHYAMKSMAQELKQAGLQ
ncbi:MAG: RNA polymerase sigma factor, partial [Limisphaerales bacterium]